MLARHGYGVLLYDARGRGESEGSPNSYGWDWEKDAFGALDFLLRQPDVQRGRVGALGLSSGADTVLELGARRPEVHAIVSDGAAARTFEDVRRVGIGSADVASGWLMFKAIGVLSGQRPSRPLGDLVPRIRAQTLLISGDRGPERDFNVAYERAGHGRLHHWNLPDAGHTAALRRYPARYEQRVVSFLDGELRRAG
jgi:pimeloyl-ACP methyl ester carboxylesterase